MATLPTPIHGIWKFEYLKKARVLKAKLSDLNFYSDGDPKGVFGQVYDDACDEGFCIQGKRHTIQFVIETVYMPGGKVEFWRLQPVHNSDRQYINSVYVYNE